MLKYAASLLLLLTAEPAAQADAGGSGPPAATGEAPAPSAKDIAASEKRADSDHIVCRKELVVGSHRPKKLCLTKGQWAEWHDKATQDMNNLRPVARAPGCDTQC